MCRCSLITLGWGRGWHNIMLRLLRYGEGRAWERYRREFWGRNNQLFRLNRGNQKVGNIFSASTRFTQKKQSDINCHNCTAFISNSTIFCKKLRKKVKSSLQIKKVFFAALDLNEVSEKYKFCYFCRNEMRCASYLLLITTQKGLCFLWNKCLERVFW